jgi:hypothetical protein
MIPLELSSTSVTEIKNWYRAPLTARHSNEKILYTLEQLRKGRNLNSDYNEDDVVDMEDHDDDAFEVLDIENTAKKVVEEMTDDSRELLALFEKYRRT